jgi:hypothetical protein
VDTILDCSQGEGERALDDIETTLVVRQFDASMADGYRQVTPSCETWLSAQAALGSTPSIDRYHRPSESPAITPPAEFHVENLPGTSYFPSGAKEEHYADIGDAVHAYLAALPSMATLPQDKKEAIAARCIAAFAVGGFLAPSDLVAAGDRFVAWLGSKYPGAVWHTETNLTSPREDGGQWTGTVDLLLQLPGGELVVIDHKSAPIRREHCAAKAATFSGQLRSYRESLHTMGETVIATWIHFPLAGVMAEMVSGDADQP